MATKPEDGMASLIRNLEESTGKSLAAWVVQARATGVVKHKALLDHLKTEYGLTHGYANQIALRALKPDDAPAPQSEELVDSLFTGSKAAVRPLYECLITALKSLGDDVELSPKKAYVSVRRSKQFALLQPAPGRLDIGIQLRAVEPEGRLEASGSFNAMVSHRVRVSSLDEVDSELLGWLRLAYEGA